MVWNRNNIEQLTTGKIMRNSNLILEEMITIALLLITLSFTSSNLTPELLRKNSFTQKLPKLAAIN